MTHKPAFGTVRFTGAVEALILLTEQALTSLVLFSPDPSGEVQTGSGLFGNATRC